MKKWLPINEDDMGGVSFAGEAFHRTYAWSWMSSNSGDCDMQARSYNDATAPVDLRRKKKKLEEELYRGKKQ